MKWKLILIVVTVVLVGGTFLWGDITAKRERAKGEGLLAQISMLQGTVSTLQHVVAVVDSQHKLSSDSVAQIEQQLRSTRALYDRLKHEPLPEIVAAAPDTCRPAILALQAHLDSVQRVADHLIDSTQHQVTILTADNDRMATALTEVHAALADSSTQLSAMRMQVASMLTKTPAGSGAHKLLGIVPLPQLWAGYGATFATDDSKLHTGVQVTLGYHLAF